MNKRTTTREDVKRKVQECIDQLMASYAKRFNVENAQFDPWTAMTITAVEDRLTDAIDRWIENNRYVDHALDEKRLSDLERELLRMITAREVTLGRNA